MDYSETLADVFVRLVALKKVKTKKDFAKLLGMSYTNLISAMKGDPRYATKSIADRAKLLLEDDNSIQRSPRKEFVIPAETLELYNNLSRTVQQQAEIIAALLNAEQKKKAE